MFYYTFTTFDCNFIPRNAEICKVSSKTKNVGKAHKYRLNRHLPTYEKIIKNLYSFCIKNILLLIMSYVLFVIIRRMCVSNINNRFYFDLLFYQKNTNYASEKYNHILD